MVRPIIILTGARARLLKIELERPTRPTLIATGASYGDAVRDAFNSAISEGFTHTIVIDTDRQSTAVDVPTFLNAIAEYPTAIINGSRPRGSLPSSVRIARGNCDVWTWLETGRWITDSPLGFRAYPLDVIRELYTGSKHQEFDVEILVKAIWTGVDVKGVALTAIANDKPQLMPLADVGRFAWLTTRLMLQRLMLPAPLKKTINTKEFAASPVTWHVGRTLRDLAMHRARRPFALAVACALGAFAGVAPIWPYQLIVALLIASFARLSKGGVIGSAIAASLGVKWLIHDRLLPADVSGHWTGRLTLAIAAAILAGVTAGFAAKALTRAPRRSA